MNATFCYKQLKTGSVRFPRTNFAIPCAGQKVVPTPTDVYVTNLGALPVRLFFTFNYPMNGSDYFNFIVSNLTNRTVEILRYQPAPVYNIGGIILDNQYTIAVQAVIDGIPRGISVPTEPFSAGYGILQFIKRLAYIGQIDFIPIPDLEGSGTIGPIVPRTASAICIDRQNNLVVAFADEATKQGYILKYSNTGAIVFPNAVSLPDTFTPYTVTTDTNSNIYVAGYDKTTDIDTGLTTISPSIVKLSGVDGSIILRASNNDLIGGIFTGITISSKTIYLCGYVISDLGTVQSVVLSKDLNFQELAADIRPQDTDPDSGNILVARSICVDTLGRIIVTGYSQTPDLTSADYFVSFYEPTTLQRLLFFTNGVPGKLTVGESVTACPDGGIALCGFTDTTLDGTGFVGTGGYNAFVSKYDFSTYTNEELLAFSGGLPLLWTKLVGSTDAGTTITQGVAIASDSQGGIYVVGKTSGGIAPFGQTGGLSDLFVIKYDASGTKKYLNQLGSTNFLPFLSTSFGNAIATNSYNDFFMAGVSDGLRFDQLTNPAGTQVLGIFITKYSATG